MLIPLFLEQLMDRPSCLPTRHPTHIQGRTQGKPSRALVRPTRVRKVAVELKRSKLNGPLLFRARKGRDARTSDTISGSESGGIRAPQMEPCTILFYRTIRSSTSRVCVA